MGSRNLLAFATTVVLATGCYVDSAQDRASMPGHPTINPPSNSTAADVGNCHYALGKGCFDGTVLAKKEFFVDGKSFFNADDLSARFKELITVQSGGKQLAPGKDDGSYQMALTTQVDNDSFVSDFSYDLTGTVSRQNKVRNDGNFSISDLPEGTYDLRVQKSIKFTLTTKAVVATSPGGTAAGTGTTPAPTTPTAPTPGTTAGSGDSAAKMITKTYCATIYQDSTVDVRKDERMNDTFSDYKLHVTDSECATTGNTTSLTLNP